MTWRCFFPATGLVWTGDLAYFNNIMWTCKMCKPFVSFCFYFSVSPYFPTLCALTPYVYVPDRTWHCQLICVCVCRNRKYFETNSSRMCWILIFKFEQLCWITMYYAVDINVVLNFSLETSSVWNLTVFYWVQKEYKYARHFKKDIS